MLRLFPKWAYGLKLKKERGKNPDVKPQQFYLQCALLTTDLTPQALLIISAHWLLANCSPTPCSPVDLLLNPKDISLDKGCAKRCKLKVFKKWSHPSFTTLHPNHLLLQVFYWQQKGGVNTLHSNWDRAQQCSGLVGQWDPAIGFSSESL